MKVLLLVVGCVLALGGPGFASAQLINDQTLHFKDNRGVNRIGVVGDTWSVVMGNHDPVWHVTDADGRNPLDDDWLRYIGSDGGDWHTKIEISSSSAGYIWDFKSEHPDNPKNTHANKDAWIFIGWDGKRYAVTTISIGAKYGPDNNHKIKLIVQQR